MSLAMTCHCGKSLRVQESLAGRKVRCPACQEVCAIPLTGAKLEETAFDILTAEMPAMPRPARPVPALRRDTTPLPSARVGPRPLKMNWKPKSKSDSTTTRTLGDDEGFGHVNARAVGGILLLAIAVAWFASGYATSYLLICPAVLGVLGLIAAVKGMFGGE